MVGVEGPQRVGVDAPAHVLGQLVLAGAQVPAQLLSVGAPRLGVAQAGEPQPAAHAVAVQQVRQQQDQLRVQRGIVGAQRLGPDLGELAIAARLGRLVTEERAPVAQLHRLGQLVHAVLDVGPARAGRALRAQGQRAPALVLEGEHLLLDDVGGLAHPAGEHLGVLEDGGVEGAVARAAQQVVRAPRAGRRRRSPSSGSTSKVPLGACSFPAPPR